MEHGVMGGASAREQMAAAIGRTLAEERRRNELRIANVRVAVLLLSMGLDWIGYFRQAFYAVSPLRGPLLSSTQLAVCLALAVALHRGWYHRLLPFLTPLLDTLIIATGYANGLLTHGPEIFAEATLPGLGVSCALVALSGGFRYDRKIAVETTVLATATYVVFAQLCHAPPAASYYVPALLLAAGSMGYWSSELGRRFLENEIGRSTVGRFLSDEVVRGAYGDPLSLLAEPRTVEATVLVSDLRGFTALAETLSPVEVLAFLNEIQGEFAAAVRQNGGTVDKFMGDGMLAVFGAPQPQADHAVRAVRAALDIRAATARVNAQRAGRGQRPVGCGVGVHSGPVVTGCLGSGERLEFTVIGDTVNTASRLESLTKEKGVDVLLSGETASRAAGSAAFLPLGEVSLRGRREPLAIHTLAA